MAKKLYTVASIQDAADAIREKNGSNTLYTVAQFGPAIRAIFSPDQSKITYGITPTNASDFITAARSAYANSSGSIVSQYKETGALPVTQSVSATGNVELSYADGKTITEVASGSYTIKHVSPNGARLSLLGTNGATTWSRAVLPMGTVRFIDSLARNARDLGGWPCDGGSVRYGIMYRTGFFSISDVAYQNKHVYLDRLGVLHHFDLRGSDSVQSPYFPVAHYYTYSGSPQYQQVISGTGDYDVLVRQILEDIMSAAAHGEPLVFNCSQGCDRTGTIAFYLLAVLGVSDVDLDIEYELSSLYDDGAAGTETFVRSRIDTGYASLKNKFTSYSGTNLSAKVINYLLSIGVSAAEMNAFRSAMIDGTPSALTAPTVSVTGTYTGCSSSNQSATAEKYQPYTATITPNSGYTLEGAVVSVTMGGADITSSAYSGGTISIASVTGNIVISVAAVQDVPDNLFFADEATDTGRFNTAGAIVAYQSGQLATGFIGAAVGDIIYIESDAAQSKNGYTGTLAAYKSDDSLAGQLTRATTVWHWSADYKKGYIVIPAEYNNKDYTQTAKIRLCIAYTSTDSIVINRLASVPTL